ncbi:MAG: aldo/keto reductase [Verrucomicrobia bacterium]|nr:aldo/keto reductase [Verrucomicrobiota bacterium]
MNKIGIGALHMGTLLDKEASRKVILRALENGVSFFDTAPLYGNFRSEEILGEVLQEVRQEVTICTKVGLKIFERKDKRFGVEVAPLNLVNLRRSVEASLKRLKRDAIDLLLLHAFDPATPIRETLEGLSILFREGKIKSFGCSNFNPKQLRVLLSQTNGAPPFIAAQCHYNMIERRAAPSFIPMCEKKNICVIVNRALARGALTGQYGVEKKMREQSRAAMSPRIQKWLTPRKLKLLDALDSTAKEHGVSLMQISLQWLLKKHSQMIVLLGVRNLDQLDECLRASREEVPQSVFEEIELIISEGFDVFQHPPRYFEK